MAKERTKQEAIKAAEAARAGWLGTWVAAEQVTVADLDTVWPCR